MRDVAAQAGVSSATVSRWLNGSIVLPDVTVSRIRQAIDHLGYQPNPHARRLSLGRSDTIALVVPDIADPFFAALAGAVEATAEARGLGVVLCATLNRTEREVDYLDRLRRNHVDGLLFATNHADDGRLRARIEDQPGVVLLDEDVQGASVPKVFCDNEAGGRLATRHLIEAGHRRIAFIGGARGVMSAVERERGYSRTLNESGTAPDPELVHFGGYTREHGAQSAERLLTLNLPPTAIFASSDQIAIGVLEVLARRGLSVPRDVSLVAYDDVAPFPLFAPAITAVRQPVKAMGALGVERLAAHLKDPTSEPRIERLSVELMPRASVASPARDGSGRHLKQAGGTGR